MTLKNINAKSTVLLLVAFAASTPLCGGNPEGSDWLKKLGRIGFRRKAETTPSIDDLNNIQPGIAPADDQSIGSVNDTDVPEAVAASSSQANQVPEANLPVETEGTNSDTKHDSTPPPLEMKIVINSRSVYEPERWNEPFQFEGKMPNPQDDERRYLILNDRALSRLHDSLDWGLRTRRNAVEQGGVLVGRVATHKNEIYNFVQEVVVANTVGSPAFVEFTTGMWAEMQGELSALNDARPAADRLVLVGWFHTHPNALSVFMSGTDKTTQRLNFSQAWQASLVVNPHTNTYRAFFGEESTEGKLILPSRIRTHRSNLRGGR